MIWLPPSYAVEPGRRYPVAYYLHGAFGNETNWIDAGRLAVTLDSLVAAGLPEMIVVMPDGDDGFYTTWNFLGDWPGCRRSRPPNAEPADSYCVPWPHYDDYIARDLVNWVDSSYRTLADRRHRGIAGLSMGGYGAITLALRYPDVFSAAASHSGVLAPTRGTATVPPSPGSFALDAIRASWSNRLWPLLAPVFGKDSISWVSRDPGTLARRLWQRSRASMPSLMVDCGTEDPYVVQSRAFRDSLASLEVPLQYREHPGSHTWDYWRRHAAESAAWLAARLTVP
jgi:putative tributyrin esterase